MDNIDAFKLKALENMKTTVNTLSNEVEKSKGYIARAEGQAQAASQARADNPLLSSIEAQGNGPFRPRAGRRSEERRVGKEGVSTCSSRWSPERANKIHILRNILMRH